MGTVTITAVVTDLGQDTDTLIFRTTSSDGGSFGTPTVTGTVVVIIFTAGPARTDLYTTTLTLEVEDSGGRTASRTVDVQVRASDLSFLAVAQVVDGDRPPITDYNQIAENIRFLRQTADGQTAILRTANRLLVGAASGRVKARAALSTGSILVGNSSQNPAGIIPNTNGHVLTSQSGAIDWRAP